MNLQKLIGLFRQLGVRDPESWAHSQINEGFPQLARCMFLRQIWQHVVSEDDPSWISHHIAWSDDDPDGSYTAAGHALKRLRARGATDEELTDLVRGMQAWLLANVCYELDESGNSDESAGVRWALMQTDEKGAVLGHMAGLHEDVAEFDPTGRDMRPRGR